jgi:PPM family protein phosphatase
MTTPDTAAIPRRKPLDNEFDVFGLTHPGKVREVNQDNFMLASLHKRMEVHFTSLKNLDELHLEGERLAYLAMVADGVGGGLGGDQASRIAIKDASQYIQSSMRCYYNQDSKDEDFLDALQDAAMACHASVVQEAEAHPEIRGMATTLTLAIGVWPRAYVLQVGDSRFYMMHEGRLVQVTRDQTIAQELVEQGVLTRSDADNTQWVNVLSSAIGGTQTAPVVTRVDQAWESVILLCSDGLTKHVSEKRIEECLANMKNAKSVCEELLQEALDGGGTDNITIVVGRVHPRPSENGEQVSDRQ